MNPVSLSVRPLMQMFEGKAKEFMNEIDNVHMIWLEEIQQEANRIFSGDFNAAPELMPKTPSQKKNSRRKRVSLGRQEESQTTRRRFSRGRRSNLRGSPVKSLNLIAEEPISEGSSSQASSTAQPKRTTRKNKQTKPDVTEDENTSVDNHDAEASQNAKPHLLNKEDADIKDETNAEEVTHEQACDAALSLPKIPSPEVVVRISSEERLSAEFVQKLEDSPGRKAVKVPIAKPPRKTRRSSARCSLKVRHSLAGLRHSKTQASVHRASQRSMLKRKAARTNNSTCSSNIDEDSPMDTADENDHVHSETEAVPTEAPPAEAVPEISKDNSQEPINAPLERITRSMVANSDKLAPPSLPASKPEVSSPVKIDVGEEQQEAQIVRRSSRSTKRKAPDTIDSPTKRFSPPKKTQSVSSTDSHYEAVKPSMRSFLHTVQKNQMLMMTPNSLGRTGVIKSFIKHTTPLKIDSKMSLGFVTKERYKLEALKKKQEQEEERMRKMEEEKRRKQEELKRKRDERIRRVLEAKEKEEQREEEKKKKIEQKMAQIDEKNDKRQADERAKKKVAMKRQEELELKKKLEEEAKKKKLQQLEEEKRQQELMAKKKAEEEEQVRRALERERELERERQAAAERERREKEKALALQRELERAAREKEMWELEERRKALEEKRKLEEQQRMAEKKRALKEREEARLKEVAAEKKNVAVLNITVDLEKSVLNTPDKKGCGLNGTYNVEPSPQSYAITPKGAKTSKNLDDYGMDQNSDDSTDDESAPRKPIPSWAEGPYLKQTIMKQYFNPPDLDAFFGTVEPPKLENIFNKSKPRYFKRTSSAVWHSPPAGAK